ncbi:MAG: hypothetical protein K8W52_27915, partial [Deltaproteobacteria bacterium]|nr:hypothetical protein [Deltaproteobacteria bacterium]
MKALVFAMVLAWGAVAWADEAAVSVSAPVPAAHELSLDDALALYRAHSDRRAATASEVDVVGADVLDARIYPNPSVSISTTNTVGGADTIGHTIGQVEVDAPILIGRQRARRGAAAMAHVAVARAELAIAQGADELEVRRRFVALLAAQARTAALASAVEDVGRVRTIVAGRAA